MADEMGRNFEDVQARLSQIVDEVSAEGISLDDALKLYEEAVKLGLSACDLSEQDIDAYIASADSVDGEPAAGDGAADEAVDEGVPAADAPAAAVADADLPAEDAAAVATDPAGAPAAFSDSANVSV